MTWSDYLTDGDLASEELDDLADDLQQTADAVDESGGSAEVVEDLENAAYYDSAASDFAAEGEMSTEYGNRAVADEQSHLDDAAIAADWGDTDSYEWEMQQAGWAAETAGGDYASADSSYDTAGGYAEMGDTAVVDASYAAADTSYDVDVADTSTDDDI